jgi:hypothetical protein
MFLIRTARDGVQTGSTRHVGHFWPILPDPGDCEDWEFGGIKNGRGNRSTRRKPCPSITLSTTNPTWPYPVSNPGRRGGKPATNRFGAAFNTIKSKVLPGEGGRAALYKKVTVLRSLVLLASVQNCRRQNSKKQWLETRAGEFDSPITCELYNLET